MNKIHYINTVWKIKKKFTIKNVINVFQTPFVVSFIVCHLLVVFCVDNFDLAITQKSKASGILHFENFQGF